MLPVHIAEAVKKQVLHYIGGTFEFRIAEAEESLSKFITDPEKGLFKGPWIQIQRPFVTADDIHHNLFDIEVPFHPFKHQILAWRRLTTKDGHKPQATIVTTGTGSGKTECFLYPVLDYALRAKKEGKDGIKAIVLYPMNALASDQERRFAKDIFKNSALRDAGLRVGIFTGRDSGDGKSSSGFKEMGKDHGISNHEALRESPPDILLTNYKMLDYLLMRPKDQRLWSFNEPGTLKYLILDELHTYDGAQGADVACLIRRLKAKLGIQKGELCTVGTSATIDEGPVADKGRRKGAADEVEGAGDVLSLFAGTLFEEDIPRDSIIGEERIPTAKLTAYNPLEEQDVVYPRPRNTEPQDGEDALQYTVRQAKLWAAPLVTEDHSALREKLNEDFIAEVSEKPDGANELKVLLWELALSEWLKKHPLFKTLLEVSEAAEREAMPLDFETLAARAIGADLDVAADFADEFKGASREEREKVVASFFALISHAKEARSGRAFPLLSIRVQLWMRELRRLGRRVSEEMRFTWLEEKGTGFKALPAFHCSLCGESGWASMKNPETETTIQQQGVEGFELLSDPTRIYRASIGFQGKRDRRLVFFSRWKEEDSPPEYDTRQQLLGEEQQRYYLHPDSLVVRRGRGVCPLTDSKQSFRVKINDRTRTSGSATVGDQGCPHCGEREGIFFIGARGAVLSSVAIDELYGSPLNADPKLLAFTDSVQDASHRAGFFSSRTYQFTLRTALQHVIDEAGSDGVPLSEVGSKLLDYWKESHRPGGGSVRAAIETLLPPDLLEYPDYLEFRGADVEEPPAKLRENIELRLYWEAVSEFGLMQTHGRTLERMGSSALGWDTDRFENCLRSLRTRLEGVDPYFERVNEQDIAIWMLGMLHRYRERGALYHPFLENYAPSGWWGKSSRGFVPPEREIFPPVSRYKPAMFVTQPKNDSKWIHILAERVGNSAAPWHIVWARRVFADHLSDQSIIDALSAFLKEGVEAELLVHVKTEAGREYYSISSEAARLYTDAVSLVCSHTRQMVVRPVTEAKYWRGAPCLEYHGSGGVYEETSFNARQNYYRARYKKGALRRVVAHEHTGILETETREQLENDFIKGQHRDDPNVLTCTSTLEMGIDIGDLSSTMLCSIPPSTANYLQRIGRAGRQTGSSFIISVVNQRPHDLFFFARPQELLKGKIDTPGCWIDAAAVLVRQYLGFCFDTAATKGIIKEFPGSPGKLVEDNAKEEGVLRVFFQWMESQQVKLRAAFMQRFDKEIKSDTRERFLMISEAFEIRNTLEKLLKAYAAEQQSITNGIQDITKRLAEEGLKPDEKLELDRDLRFLNGRKFREQRRTAYEFLCENGLLPNYAFPDRGVRFFGSVYGRNDKRADKTVELYRGPAQALRELAPHNHFYTHNRRFQVQRVPLGSAQDEIVEEFGVCASCGYMGRINKAEKLARCPQCHTSGPRAPGGHRHNFVEFPRTYALSQMEFYDSYSADRGEERERAYYRHVSSFDLADDGVSVGVVGDDDLPFGIEYRSELTLREVNTGFYESDTSEVFGPGQEASEEGFVICKDCGVIVGPNDKRAEVRHARTCAGNKKAIKLEKAGKNTDKAYTFERVYLYREIKSEAIRLLVKYSDAASLLTLQACIELGLKKKFEGNPAHILIRQQAAVDAETGVTKNYLVLLDGVPGGTGYLKTLYDEMTDGKKGAGIMDVLREALKALETCRCRNLGGSSHDDSETDGCYRCVRNYGLQYRSEEIKRSAGVEILKELIAAGERRTAKKDLEAISVNALFESNLEKEFIESLRGFAREQEGTLSNVIVRGKRGYRLELPRTKQIWEIELQRALNEKDGVSIMSRPDFIFWPEEAGVRPVAVFTDGKRFHAEPGENNILAKDFEKRRSILKSSGFWVFSLTWNDLMDDSTKNFYGYNKKLEGNLGQVLAAHGLNGKFITKYAGLNPYMQLCGFLLSPREQLWRQLSSSIGVLMLTADRKKGRVYKPDFEEEIWKWREGTDLNKLEVRDDGDCFYSARVSPSSDFLVFSDAEGLESKNPKSLRFVARLPDSDECVGEKSFLERWRQFLAIMNFYQFQPEFYFWAASECSNNTAPEVDMFMLADKMVSKEWSDALELTLSRLRPHLEKLAYNDLACGVPEIELEHPEESDEVAELGWAASRVVVLCGSQADFRDGWEKSGYRVYTEESFIKVLSENEYMFSNYLEESV